MRDWVKLEDLSGKDTYVRCSVIDLMTAQDGLRNKTVIKNWRGETIAEVKEHPESILDAMYLEDEKKEIGFKNECSI